MSLCGEHGCPLDQCEEFTHAAECSNWRAYIKGLAKGIELALADGVPLSERETEVKLLLGYIREHG